jgi:hypothetical protein
VIRRGGAEARRTIEGREFTAENAEGKKSEGDGVEGELIQEGGVVGDGDAGDVERAAETEPVDGREIFAEAGLEFLPEIED